MPQIIRDNVASGLDVPRDTLGGALDGDSLPGSDPLDRPDQPIGEDEDAPEIGEPDALDIEEIDPEMDESEEPEQDHEQTRDA